MVYKEDRVMREEKEVKDEIRQMMDKRQKLESNLVGVNRYIDVLKKELCLIIQIKEMQDE
jgi:hypothetical protein